MEGKKKDFGGVRTQSIVTIVKAEKVPQRRRECQQKKKAGRQETVCDNLVEETGLCVQHCLETENIFYREDLDWIIQVKRSDLS